MADVPNATAPRAWSADIHDFSRNAYRNSDLQVKMLHSTTMLRFDDCKALTVLVQNYKNI